MNSYGEKNRVAHHQTVYRMYESCVARRALDITLAKEGRLQKSPSTKRWRRPDNIPGSQRPAEFSPTSPVYAHRGFWMLDRPTQQRVRAQNINSALLNCVCQDRMSDNVSHLEITSSLNRK